MKQTMRCIAAGVLAVIGIMMGERLPLQAAGTGTLRVVYSCDSGRSGIEGAELSAVRVAKGTVEQGRMVYTMKEAYAGTGLDPQKPSFWKDKKAADKLLECHRAQTGKTSGADNAAASGKGAAAAVRRTTDAEGNAYFTGCPAGIYLVWQSGAAGKSAAYETAGPLLVTIPANPTDEKAEWSWDAVVYPKTSARTRTAETPGGSDGKTQGTYAESSESTATESTAAVPELQPVQISEERGAGTGDPAAAGGLLAAAVLSAAGLTVYCRQRGRRNAGRPGHLLRGGRTDRAS